MGPNFQGPDDNGGSHRPSRPPLNHSRSHLSLIPRGIRQEQPNPTNDNYNQENDDWVILIVAKRGNLIDAGHLLDARGHSTERSLLHLCGYKRDHRIPAFSNALRASLRSRSVGTAFKGFPLGSVGFVGLAGGVTPAWPSSVSARKRRALTSVSRVRGSWGSITAFVLFRFRRDGPRSLTPQRRGLRQIFGAYDEDPSSVCCPSTIRSCAGLVKRWPQVF